MEVVAVIFLSVVAIGLRVALGFSESACEELKKHNEELVIENENLIDEFKRTKM